MSSIFQLAIFSVLAGLAIPIGGLIACSARVSPNWLQTELRHSIFAFGGGVLLSAVALVLVPEGIKSLNVFWASLWFFLGGLACMFLMLRLSTSPSAGAQFVAMLADFIPESVAMGAAYAHGSSTGMLLAILITLQNIPEGFNAYRELRLATDYSKKRILLRFGALALLGPACAFAGYYLLADLDSIVAALMLAGGGGILYLTFEDLAPSADLQFRFTPSMGAVTGFMLGLIGHLLITA